MELTTGPGLQLILLVAFLIPAILFILTQHRTLELVRRENRRMPPARVWLQLIPLFGLVWQFYVIRKISDSIRAELNSPIGDSIFGEVTSYVNARPTYQVGMGYATAVCISVLPLYMFKGIAALIGMGLWIAYWVQLSQYKKKLRERALLLNS